MIKHYFTADVEKLFDKLPKAQLTLEECDDIFVSIMDDMETLEDRITALEENQEMITDSLEEISGLLMTLLKKTTIKSKK